MPKNNKYDIGHFIHLNTNKRSPSIFKYPFWKMTLQSRNLTYACINREDTYITREIQRRSVCIAGGIGTILSRLPTLQSLRRLDLC